MSFKSVFQARFLFAAAVALFSATPGHAEVVMTFASPADFPGSTVSGSLSFDPSTFTPSLVGPNTEVYQGLAEFTATVGSTTYSASSVFKFTMSTTSGFPFYFEAQAQAGTGIYMELNSSSPTALFGNLNDPGSFLSQQISGEFFLDPVSPDLSNSDITLFDPVTINVSAVPEPSTWAMMIFGFFAIAFMAYRKKAALRFP